MYARVSYEDVGMCVSVGFTNKNATEGHCDVSEVASRIVRPKLRRRTEMDDLKEMKSVESY